MRSCWRSEPSSGKIKKTGYCWGRKRPMKSSSSLKKLPQNSAVFSAVQLLLIFVRGASKIKLKKVNKKRTVRVRRVIIFLHISRHPLPLIWFFFYFWGQKNSLAKYCHKVAKKMVFFWKIDLNLFRQDIKKIYLLITLQQSLKSGQKTTGYRHYWQILV